MRQAAHVPPLSPRTAWTRHPAPKWHPSSPVAASPRRNLFASPAYGLAHSRYLSPPPSPPPPAPRPLMTTVPVPEDVQDAFDYFDDNKSGFLDYVQLHNALQHYTFETNIDDAIELVHTHDIDGDGKLNLDEFYGLLLHAAVNIPAAFNKPANPPSEAYDYLQIFDYYDTNRSGLLDVRELHAALNDMQLGATIDDAIDLVRQYSTSTIDRLDPQAFSLLLNDLTTMPAWGPWTHATPPYQYMFTERPDARRPAPIGMPNYFATTMLLPATVGSVFDGCDVNGTGLLDARRTRDGLLSLGCRLTLGEVARLVRRFGTHMAGYRDAVVTMNQFISIIDHLRGVPLLRDNPYTVPPRSYTGLDPLPGPMADLGLHPVGGSPRSRAWYGHRPFMMS